MSVPGSNQAPDPTRLRRSRPFPAAAAAFPLLLLFFATFFLFGQIGFWSDDYYYNLRDPVTGEFPASLLMSRHMFLRPLFYRTVPPLITLAWDHSWLLHLLQVLLHGLFALLLFSFLRTLGAAKGPAVAAVLLFMVYPVHFEAVLWISAIPTLLASGAMIGLLFLTIWFARSAGPLRKLGGWWSVPVMMGWTYLVCCLNEQPTAAIAIMPLLYFCALCGTRGRADLHPGSPLFAGAATGPTRWAAVIHHLPRAITPAVLCAGVVAIYTRKVVSTAPEFSRGSARSFVPLDQMWDRAIVFWESVWNRLVMNEFARGAFSLGWRELHRSPLLAVTWGMALLAAFAAFAWWWCRPSRDRPESPPNRPGIATCAMPLLALTGLALFFSGFIPIMVFINHEPDSRMWYWPCVGLAMVIAVMFSLAPSATRADQAGKPVIKPPGTPRHFARAGSLIALAPMLAIFSIMFIGAQAGFKTRWDRDQFEASELRRLIPDPDPLSFFLPMQFERTAVQTGSSVFDRHFRSVWEFEWTGRRYLPHIYQRPVVHCGYFQSWTTTWPVIGAAEEGISYGHRLGPRFPQHLGGSRIPWDRALPFTVTADGSVRLATHIIIEATDDHAETVFAIPQAQHLPEFTIRLPRG